LESVYLVTGAAGFIGSNIVESLLKKGVKVKAIDNFLTGKRENIEPFLSDIEFTEGDIRDLNLMREVMEGVDFVLHQAAVPSVPRSVKDPSTSNSANVDGTLNVLIAARDRQVKRVVYASSSSVYGNSKVLPKKEDMKLDPLSPYAVSKLAGEYYCRVFYKVYGLETICLRYFNVFGPHQDPTSQYSAVIPKFIKCFKAKEPIPVYGTGEQSRDFTFVENVVEANLRALEAKNVAGEVFNIACGNQFTLNQLVDFLREIFKSNLEAENLSPRIGEVKHSFADIGKASKFLGYKPKVDFRMGLERTVEWFLNS